MHSNSQPIYHYIAVNFRLLVREKLSVQSIYVYWTATYGLCICLDKLHCRQLRGYRQHAHVLRVPGLSAISTIPFTTKHVLCTGT
jgi:hypothetical protein